MNKLDATVLLRQADEMEQNSRTLRRLANAMAELPTPLGAHVLLLADALHPYGLCIVRRDVLEIAKTAIDAWDADEADHPDDVRKRQQAVLSAIHKSLNPPIVP